MKATLVFAVVLFLLLAAACGGNDGDFLANDGDGDGSNFLPTDSVRDDRVGENPAAQPEERDEAIRNIARTLIAPRVTDPYEEGSLFFEIRNLDVIAGRASLMVTGVFIVGDDRQEKYALAYLVRDADGGWILDSISKFDWTLGEQHRQNEIKHEQAQEARNQAEIARLTKIIEDFDRITFKVSGIEKIPGPLGDESYTGFYLTVDIGNPSSERHNSVGYLVKWQAHLTKYNIGCPVEDQAPETVTGEEEDSIYGLEPGETYQVRHRISVGSMSCAILDITVDPTPSVSVTSLDGFKSKEEVEAAIAQLQTSPNP